MYHPEKSFRQQTKEDIEKTLQYVTDQGSKTNDLQMIEKCMKIAEISLGMIRDLSVESDLFTFSDEEAEKA